jgi:His Kinase A (phospho-acceptor) domain
VGLRPSEETAWPDADSDGRLGARSETFPNRHSAMSDRLDAAPGRYRRQGRLAAFRRRVWAAVRRMAGGGQGAEGATGIGGFGSIGGIGDDRDADGPDSRLIHDLRTPLTSIRSFSEILRHHPELSQMQRTRYLDIILNEGRRLEHVIEDFEAQTGPDPAR